MNLTSMSNHVPPVIAEQMRKVDQIAIHKLGIRILEMMENAGRNMAESLRRHVKNAVMHAR